MLGRRLRIAFISEHASPTALVGGQDAGGQNVYVDAASRSLAALGHSVDIFTRRDDPDLPPIIDWAPGVRVIHVDAGPARSLPKDDLWPLMPEFRDSMLRHITRSQSRYHLIHGHFWMSGWVATQLGRQLDIPVVQLFHALGATKQRHQGMADTSPSERIEIERAIVRNVDQVIAQCPAERTELIEDYAADPSRISIISPGVNTRTFHPVDRLEARRRIGIAPDGPVIVYVGRILPRKDVRNVVRAVGLLHNQADAPPVRLLVVGGETAEPDPEATPEIGVLRQLAAEQGIADRVIFTGMRQPAELRDYYSAGDIAVTTPWYEPFGLTPLEAMACGRPVIGAAVGGISFTIMAGVTGLLVPPRDPEMLSQRIIQLLTQPELCERMGQVARARVEQQFSWERFARRTVDLYESVLAEREQGHRAMATRRTSVAATLGFNPIRHPASD